MGNVLDLRVELANAREAVDVSSKPYDSSRLDAYDLRGNHCLKVSVRKAQNKHLPDFFLQSPIMGKGRVPQRRSKHQYETDEVTSEDNKMSRILFHMHHGVRKILLSLICSIGVFCFKVSSEEQNPTDIKPVVPHLVEVEPTFVAPIDNKGNFALLPYKIRRPRWGKTLSVGASTFTAKEYISEVGEPGVSSTPVSYGDVYKTNMPMLEWQVVLKRNISIGSIGLEVGGGYQRNYSYPAIDLDDGNGAFELNQTLDIVLVRVGIVYSLDTLFVEPYFVPYVSGGAYTIIHFENGSAATESPNGNTQAAPYFSFGAMAQLDWIDKSSSRSAYREVGLESTYVYAEGRMLMASSSGKDQRFDTGLTANGGLRVEF